MLSLEEIRKKLEDRNIAVVAEKTGLAADTVYRIANGKGTPSYGTVKILSDYLQGITNGQA